MSRDPVLTLLFIAVLLLSTVGVLFVAYPVYCLPDVVPVIKALNGPLQKQISAQAHVFIEVEKDRSKYETDAGADSLDDVDSGSCSWKSAEVKARYSFKIWIGFIGDGGEEAYGVASLDASGNAWAKVQNTTVGTSASASVSFDKHWSERLEEDGQKSKRSSDYKSDDLSYPDRYECGLDGEVEVYVAARVYNAYGYTAIESDAHASAGAEIEAEASGGGGESGEEVELRIWISRAKKHSYCNYIRWVSWDPPGSVVVWIDGVEYGISGSSFKTYISKGMHRIRIEKLKGDIVQGRFSFWSRHQPSYKRWNLFQNEVEVDVKKKTILVAHYRIHTFITELKYDYDKQEIVGRVLDEDGDPIAKKVYLEFYKYVQCRRKVVLYWIDDRGNEHLISDDVEMDDNGYFRYSFKLPDNCVRIKAVYSPYWEDQPGSNAYGDEWAYMYSEKVVNLDRHYSVLHVRAQGTDGTSLSVKITYFGDFSGMDYTPFNIEKEVYGGSSAFTVMLTAPAEVTMSGARYAFIKWVISGREYSSVSVEVQVPDNSELTAVAMYECVSVPVVVALPYEDVCVVLPVSGRVLVNVSSLFDVPSVLYVKLYRDVSCPVVLRCPIWLDTSSLPELNVAYRNSTHVVARLLTPLVYGNWCMVGDLLRCVRGGVTYAVYDVYVNCSPVCRVVVNDVDFEVYGVYNGSGVWVICGIFYRWGFPADVGVDCSRVRPTQDLKVVLRIGDVCYVLRSTVDVVPEWVLDGVWFVRGNVTYVGLFLRYGLLAGLFDCGFGLLNVSVSWWPCGVLPLVYPRVFPVVPVCLEVVEVLDEYSFVVRAVALNGSAVAGGYVVGNGYVVSIRDLGSGLFLVNTSVPIGSGLVVLKYVPPPSRGVIYYSLEVRL